MAMTAVAPVGKQQFFDDGGDPLAFGKLYSYVAGSDTPQYIYTDALLQVPYDNPIELDSAGRPAGAMYFLPTPAYKLELRDADDVTIWTVDEVIAVQGTA